MTKEPARELRVVCHPSEQRIEVVLLRDGMPVDSIKFDEAGAVSFTRAIVDAADRLRERRSQIVLPEKVGRTPWL